MGTQPHRTSFVIDPATGLPALSADPNAPILTSKELEEILERAQGEILQKQKQQAKRHRKD